MNKNFQKNKQNKRLPLNSDIVFKRVFSKEENKELLKSLLESILNIKIENVEVKNPEIPRDLSDSRAGLLDIKAKIDNNTIVDIEMQVENEHNIDDRSVFYAASLISDEIKIGDPYTDLGKTITINILNFNYYKRNSFHSIAHMKFEKTTEEAYVDLGYSQEDEIVTPKIEMHFIELKKFIKKNLNTNKTLNSWLWLISGKEDKIEMAKNENKEIKKAIEIINEMSMDPKEWELYEARQKALMDYHSGLKIAERNGIEKRYRKTALRNGIKKRY